MQIQDLMNREVQTCRPEDSMNEAARIMWERDCGCVPVVDEQKRVLGMITDRDVCMAAYTQGRRLQNLPVHVAMSNGATACRATDDLETALQAMRGAQVRRLPVVDSEDRIVGIVSVTDLILAAQARTGQPRQIAAGALLQTLAQVQQPRNGKDAAEPERHPVKRALTTLPAAARASSDNSAGGRSSPPKSLSANATKVSAS